jgi:hypothetical protein
LVRLDLRIFHIRHDDNLGNQHLSSSLHCVFFNNRNRVQNVIILIIWCYFFVDCLWDFELSMLLSVLSSVHLYFRQVYLLALFEIFLTVGAYNNKIECVVVSRFDLNWSTII